MKAKINKLGQLSIFRKDKYKEQYCPRTIDDKCGDWCPKFREPTFGFCKNKRGQSIEGFIITICGDDLLLEELIDER